MVCNGQDLDGYCYNYYRIWLEDMFAAVLTVSLETDVRQILMNVRLIPVSKDKELVM